MTISRRDIVVALVAAAGAWSATAYADGRAAVLGPAVWEWNGLQAKPTDVGCVVLDGGCAGIRRRAALTTAPKSV